MPIDGEQLSANLRTLAAGRAKADGVSPRCVTWLWLAWISSG